MVIWTGTARRKHSREGLRYPSDLTDVEWALAAPFVPPARRGGRPRTADMREVLNAMLYIAASGCAWRLLPKCFPPVSTALRGVALGRRNWMFVGSTKGGDASALFYSLAEACRLNGVEPEAWSTDVIARIGNHPIKRIDALLPWRWQDPRETAEAA